MSCDLSLAALFESSNQRSCRRTAFLQTCALPVVDSEVLPSYVLMLLRTGSNAPVVPEVLCCSWSDVRHGVSNYYAIVYTQFPA